MADAHVPKADQQLALAALQKQRRGERPNRQELAALRRVEAARDTQQRLDHYRTVPKGAWREWSGRQHKVLNEQATRYGLPIGGPIIDLPAVVRWLHDFLADNARRLAGPDDADPALAGVSSPALERYRLARAKREELAYSRDLREWLPREQVHVGLATFASIIRRAGETLQRQFGAAAHEILDEALTNAIGALQHNLDSGDGLPDGDPGDP